MNDNAFISEKIGIKVPDVLLPKEGIDLNKWSVVACDQFTSEPEYWQDVSRIVGDSPSSLNIIYPEAYLNESDNNERISRINQTMKYYLSDGIFKSSKNMIYIQRKVNNRIRHGLILCIDLEKYDYNPGSTSLIRATEGTIIERIPPRLRVRENAVLECPHIMLLIDDPDKMIIEPLFSKNLTKAYDFELMKQGGFIKGFYVDENSEKDIIAKFNILASFKNYMEKYSLNASEHFLKNILLFAVGDGNHSLATAKALWDNLKSKGAGLDHPARHALVEVVNLHDSSLEFKPIHRVIFDAKENFIEQAKLFFNDKAVYEKCNKEQMISIVQNQKDDEQAIGIFNKNEFGVLRFINPEFNLAVASVQPFIDEFVKSSAKGIDYVHGDETIMTLGSLNNNIGIFLPAIQKYDFFKTIIKDGSFPRKTFSLGEANEKRYYMECRKIK